MKKLLCTFLVTICSFNVLFAQDTVYFSKQSALRDVKKKSSSEKNIIKIAPLNFIAGNVPIFLEREINPFLGLQVGAGITTQNYLKEMFSSSEITQPDIAETKWNDGTTDTYQNEGSLTDYKHRKASLGYYIAVEPRIYFENEGLDGSFISISYSKARYNTSADQIVTGASSSNGDAVFTKSKFTEHENISDLMANFGTQTLYDHISLEYSTGIGLRTIQGVKYAYGRDNSGNFIDGVNTIKKTKIGFNLSIKVGYHF